MNNMITGRKPGFPQGFFLLLPIVLGVVGVSVFTATVNQMQEHFHYVPNGAYWVNLLQTMPGFWIVAFSPIAGWLADRYGRRNILMASMVVYALVGVAPFWMENIWAILVTRCFVGMCESVVLTVTTTMLCDYFHGKSRERWLASQTGVASLSALLIIPLGGVLGARFGWQGPFLVYLVSLVLVVFVAIYAWEPEHVAPTTDEIAKVNADAIYQSIPWGRMSGIILITLVGSVFFYSTITQNANALVQLGVRDPAQIGTYATWASLGVPVGTVLFWFLGRLHIGLLLFVDFLIIGIGFVLMSTAGTPSAYVMAADLQQLGCGLVLPTLLVWATRGLAYHIRGRGNGLWQGAFGLGLFASGMVLQYMGSLLGGSILAAFGVLGRVSLTTAAIALVAWVAFGRGRTARAGAQLTR
ncbi:MAG: MFS transporter [Proteobacteria bacterium]|nr:MFS transporter [Pseudomonadota bacterium]